MPTLGPRHRITANLFSIPLGLCGLAQCWTAAADLGVAPVWPATTVWAVAAVVWLVVAIAYYGRNHTGTALAGEFADPTFGPFIAVFAIVPMVLGGALARVAPAAGHAVFVVALILTLVLGGWLSGQWIISELTLAQWHPGYLLPTVGGGFIAAATAAGFAQHSLALGMFGYGVLCWMVLGSIVFARLFTQPRLPPALQGTLAIELAPPVVAGLAWFGINGGRADPVAFVLAGYASLMGLVQIRLIPLYRRLPFGPGWWAFSFPYAAATVYGIRWLAMERVAAMAQWTWALLAAITDGIVFLIVRTAIALRRHRFLPPVAPPSSTASTVPKALSLHSEAVVRSEITGSPTKSPGYR